MGTISPPFVCDDAPWLITSPSLPSSFSPVCDSYVRPETLVRICDECNFGTYGGRCIICGSPGTPPCSHRSPDRSVYTESASSPLPVGISDAYYCAECTRLEKDRDGCPKIVNLGASRTDLFYERRRLGASPTSLGGGGRGADALYLRAAQGSRRASRGRVRASCVVWCPCFRSACCFCTLRPNAPASHMSHTSLPPKIGTPTCGPPHRARARGGNAG